MKPFHLTKHYYQQSATYLEREKDYPFQLYLSS
jgi:hypothetical protein